MIFKTQGFGRFDLTLAQAEDFEQAAQVLADEYIRQYGAPGTNWTITVQIMLPTRNGKFGEYAGILTIRTLLGDMAQFSVMSGKVVGRVAR